MLQTKKKNGIKKKQIVNIEMRLKEKKNTALKRKFFLVNNDCNLPSKKSDPFG